MRQQVKNKALQTVEDVAVKLQREPDEKQKFLDGLEKVQREIESVRKKQERQKQKKISKQHARKRRSSDRRKDSGSRRLISMSFLHGFLQKNIMVM